MIRFIRENIAYLPLVIGAIGILLVIWGGRP